MKTETFKKLQVDIVRAATIALEEDIGTGDITAQLIPIDQENAAQVITREDCVVCGQAWFDEVFRQLDKSIDIRWYVKDGDFVEANTKLVSIKGNTRTLLTGERSALNFLQLLSGVATKSREYAKFAENTGVKILDTRKTIPSLRTAQKYAVRCGGCYNHRMGLYEAFLIKENHITACGGIAKAITKARKIAPEKMVEVEVENMDELELAIEEGADVVMLDNFSDENIVKASIINNKRVKLEASGNINSNKLNFDILSCLDFISIGELTKTCRAIDLSMRILD